MSYCCQKFQYMRLSQQSCQIYSSCSKLELNIEILQMVFVIHLWCYTYWAIINLELLILQMVFGIHLWCYSCWSGFNLDLLMLQMVFGIHLWCYTCWSGFNLDLLMLQMVFGIATSAQAYRLLSSGHNCNVSYFHLHVTFCVYLSYFILFGHFFYKAYLSKSPPRKLQQNGVKLQATNGVKNGVENGLKKLNWTAIMRNKDESWDNLLSRNLQYAALGRFKRMLHETL